MFQKFSDFLTGVFGSAAGIVMIGFYILLPIGDLYWLWMSFQFGSFWMFALGLMGPTILFAAPVGAYSLIFGVPDWVFNVFG
jgi:hypothetical protein